MKVCSLCQKGIQTVAYSRHKKGHGVSGAWRLRAQIVKKVHRPNLHVYQGMKLCSKCLRAVKRSVEANREVPTITPVA